MITNYLKQYLLLLFLLCIVFWACSPKLQDNSTLDKETVRIANDSLEYEVIIQDVGFVNYLNTLARPINYYSLEYLENWNKVYVTNWNIRVNNPSAFDQNIYFNRIDYEPFIDYGLEVNYKLFNYFQFAQLKYNMRLDGDNSGNVILR